MRGFDDIAPKQFDVIETKCLDGLVSIFFFQNLVGFCFVCLFHQEMSKFWLLILVCHQKKIKTAEFPEEQTFHFINSSIL